MLLLLLLLLQKGEPCSPYCFNLCKSICFRPLFEEAGELSSWQDHPPQVCGLCRGAHHAQQVVLSQLSDVAQVGISLLGEIALRQGTPLAVLTVAADAPPGGLAQVHC